MYNLSTGAAAIWCADCDHPSWHSHHQTPGAAPGWWLLPLLWPTPGEASKHGAGQQTLRHLVPSQPEAPEAWNVIRNTTWPFAYALQTATDLAREEQRTGDEEERGPEQKDSQEPESFFRWGVRSDAVSCPQDLHCRGTQGKKLYYLNLHSKTLQRLLILVKTVDSSELFPDWQRSKPDDLSRCSGMCWPGSLQPLADKLY